ncbi:MAG: CAP domain-containing protein [Chloroflexi bacterium]|nr:CAP domain-containing protein [Chloroflexota bacterium]
MSRGLRGSAVLLAVSGLVPLALSLLAAPAAAAPGRISGQAPPPGAFGLVVWGGGPVVEIAPEAEAQGCSAVSTWANRPGGGLVGYIFRAPDFVNRPFVMQYGSALPADTPLVLVCAPVIRPLAPAPTPAISTDEARMAELINAERVRAGLGALRLDPQMSAVARAHSRDMTDRRYFGHTNPDGDSPFDRMRAADIPFGAAAENIAGSSGVDRAHGMLMNSSGHRSNILGGDFTRIGVGIATNPEYGWTFTQVFAD